MESANKLHTSGTSDGVQSTHDSFAKESRNAGKEAPTNVGSVEDQGYPQRKSKEQGHDTEKMNDEETDFSMSYSGSRSLIHESFILGIICIAQFSTQAALGQTLTLVHIIGAHFGLTNPGQLSWLVAGYSLTVGSFILIAGRLGDYFGYKKILILGFAWFSIWTLVAGLSFYSTYVLFVFARVLQGIGPAMCLPNSIAILGATYPPGPRKNLVFAIFGATAPGGCVIGAIFGGIFQDNWPWAFYSLALVLATTAAACLYIIPDPPTAHPAPAHKSLRVTMEQLDVLGGAVGVAALALFNFAWNQAAVVGWTRPYIYVTLALGVLLFLAFFYVEFWVSSSPLLPFDVVSADVGFVLASVSCGWACFGIWLYYTWQFFQEVRGASPLLSSAYFTPSAVSGIFAAITTGILLSRLHPAWVMTMSLASFTVATVLIATAPSHQTYWAQTFVSTILISWGVDMTFPAGIIILSNAVKQENQGIGASLINTVVNYSISIGLGLAGTVEAHVSDGSMLKGYRGALYMGIGTASLGFILSLIFLTRRVYKPSNLAVKNEETEPQLVT